MRSILLFVFLLITQIAQSDNWTQKSNFAGIKRIWSFSFSLLGNGYVGCGIDTVNTLLKDFWEYNPISDTWSQKADFVGIPRAYGIGISIDNYGYAGLGSGSQSFNLHDWWQYDPISNSWNQKANYPGAGVYFISGFSAVSKGFVCFGENTTPAITNELWEYDPSNDQWTQKMSLPGSARKMAATFSINDKGYCGTGTYAGNYLYDFWEYDVILNSWTQKANYPGIASVGSAAFSIGDKGYIEGGNGFFASEFWQFDPTINQWSQKSYGPNSSGLYDRISPIHFSIGSKGYVGMGAATPGNLHFLDLWEYTPDSITGILENSINSEIKLAPNPLINCTLISFNYDLTNATIELVEITGRKVEIINNVNGNKFNLTCDQIKNGIYLCNVFERGKLIFSTRILIL